MFVIFQQPGNFKPIAVNMDHVESIRVDSEHGIAHLTLTGGDQEEIRCPIGSRSLEVLLKDIHDALRKARGNE